MSEIDLQIHSDFSDGTLTPDEIMALCKNEGIKIASITDHDTVAHVEASRKAGEMYGIKTVSGTELSTVHKGKEVHLLGYDFDHTNQELMNMTNKLAQSRDTRAEGMIKRLHKAGWAVSLDDVKEKANGPIGRPHVARAVLEHEENQERLQTEKLVNMSDFIVNYLEPGKPGYVERFKLTTDEAIRILHEAGGVAVLSHPGWTFKDQLNEIADILEEYRKIGVDGAEVFCRTYTHDMTVSLHEATIGNDMFETTGSDFHDPNHELFGKLGGGDTYDLKPVWPYFLAKMI
jgi:3',5'-nucleoside bisphosphate phosphatase